jgi:hypothetical protein
MRSLAPWVALTVLAVGVAACAGGSTTVAPPIPAATTASNAISLPTTPAGSSAAVVLPGPINLVPSLAMGAGYAVGTQMFVTSANYGQTSAAARSVQAKFSQCQALLNVTAYFTANVPFTAIQSFSVALGSALSFLNGASVTASIWDAGATIPTGTPAPAPQASNGCPTEPVNQIVIASQTATVANQQVTFANLQGNTNLAASLQTKYGVTGGAAGAIPANALFGIYVKVNSYTPPT